MTCPHCDSSNIGGRKRQTSLGSRTFACRDCRRTFNERTGAFKHLDRAIDRDGYLLDSMLSGQHDASSAACWTTRSTGLDE